MNNECCLAGRVFLPLLLLGGNVLAMDEREAAADSDNDWSIVSAPPPPGPYRSVNIDPRIPGQDAVSVPGLSQDISTSSPLPAEALRMPPAAGGVAPEPAMPGSPPPPDSRDYIQPPGPGYKVQSSRPGGYRPPPPPGGYTPYEQAGRSEGYGSTPYTHDYVPAPSDFEQPPHYADTIPPPPGAYEQPQPSEDYIPSPPGAYEDYDQQPVPGPYGHSMQQPPAYNYPRSERYPRQPVQQGYRRPPPGYYSPSAQRPLQEAPQPPIYDNMMGQPSGGSAIEDASAGVPQ